MISDEQIVFVMRDLALPVQQVLERYMGGDLVQYEAIRDILRHVKIELMKTRKAKDDN